MQVKKYLDLIKPLLAQLNRQYFADLRSQTDKAKSDLSNVQLLLQQDPTNEVLMQKEKDARKRYADILTSSLSLIQQQSKIEWIKYGDDNTRFFHAKAKQRKMASYTFSLDDCNGRRVDGFEQVQ